MFSPKFPLRLSPWPRRAAALLGLVPVALLAGCGGGGGNGNPTVISPITTGATGIGTTSGTTTIVPASVSVPEANGLTATLSESATTVAVGGTVTYTLTQTNNTGAIVTISGIGATAASPAQAPAALSVLNSAGSPVFVPPPGPPPLDSVSISPGQSLTTTQAVSGFGSAGTYSATAVFGVSGASTVVGPLTVTAQ